MNFVHPLQGMGRQQFVQGEDRCHACGLQRPAVLGFGWKVDFAHVGNPHTRRPTLKPVLTCPNCPPPKG